MGISDLAIVIPAFKIDFFERSLASIHAQTNKDFNLYVIVDGSKEDFDSVIRQYSFPGKFIFHTFPNNLGKKDLVEAWNRCLEFVENENWIWLFSDDDEMDIHCVQWFYDKIIEDNERYDLYRFNNVKINENSQVISKISKHPEIESSESFLRRRLHYQTSNFVSEYIFNRNRFYECGGFVSFPAAWATDDATWIQLGLKKNIYTLQGGIVKWRKSFINISGIRGDKSLRRKKKAASIMFVNWACRVCQTNNFNIQDEEFLEWFLIMLKIIGYKRNKLVYPISVVKLRTFKFSTIYLNIKFIYKWFTDADPDWL